MGFGMGSGRKGAGPGGALPPGTAWVAAVAAGFLLTDDGLEGIALARERGLPMSTVLPGLQGAMIANGFPPVSDTTFRRALAMVSPSATPGADRFGPLRRLAAADRAPEAAVAGVIAGANPPWDRKGLIKPGEVSEAAARALARGLPVPPLITGFRASPVRTSVPKSPIRELARAGDHRGLSKALAKAADTGLPGRASLGRLLTEAAALSATRVPEWQTCPVCMALLAAGASPNKPGEGGAMPWDLAKGRTSAIIRAAANFSLVSKRPPGARGPLPTSWSRTITSRT